MTLRRYGVPGFHMSVLDKEGQTSFYNGLVFFFVSVWGKESISLKKNAERD